MALDELHRAPCGHVPAGYTQDGLVIERFEAQLERFAPGFATRVRARSLMQSERENPSLVGGDLAEGSYELDRQLVIRPAPELARYRTPLRGLYIAGASTHPGGAVHAISARAAARQRRGAPDVARLGSAAEFAGRGRPWGRRLGRAGIGLRALGARNGIALVRVVLTRLAFVLLHLAGDFACVVSGLLTHDSPFAVVPAGYPLAPANAPRLEPRRRPSRTLSGDRTFGLVGVCRLRCTGSPS